MGVPHLFEKPILFIGVLFSEKNIFDATFTILRKNFGNVLFQSDVDLWQYTDHYHKELGIPIFRNFIFFEKIIDPS